jgi:hypothetical protein
MKYILLSISVILSFALHSQKPVLSVKSGQLELVLNEFGYLHALNDTETGKNYLHKKIMAPLIQVRSEGKYLRAMNMMVEERMKTISIGFQHDIVVKVKYQVKDTYITFEILEAERIGRIDLICWGPFPTVIDGIIGETVGVVRSEDFALGLQSLNPKTLGGYPWLENDAMPEYDIFESGDFSNVKKITHGDRLYRVEAARPTDYGSNLQAFCRNRFEDRTVPNMKFPEYISPAFDDGGIIGSKIALFGCAEDKVLDVIEAIERGEGLPHPMVDGEWVKRSPAASAAYIILDFSEDNLDQALEITKKAGLRYLYHFNAFETWGNFMLKEEFFPNGIKGLEKCVKIAEEEKIMLGVHFLSNFITTNDAYVTPLPDPRLAIVGSSSLYADINDSITTLAVADASPFKYHAHSTLKTIRINEELITFTEVLEGNPTLLRGCTRGAFGTKASAHDRDEPAHLLADHPYKVFLTNAELSKEVSRNMAEIFNQAGLRQISFDGLEGNRSTGMGNYGEILFTKEWYDHLSPEIKSHYIADASRTSHYFWHVYTRMNWGEPWYAGFRESQTEYRLKNQKYFKRNYMPGMLGWFLMRPTTSIEDIEWLLARSAGFDAGYSFVVDFNSLEENGQSDKILELIGLWEEARMSSIFSEDVKMRMQDIKNEFRLERVSKKKMRLREFEVLRYRIDSSRHLAVGSWQLKNDSFVEEEPIHFILHAEDTSAMNIEFRIDMIEPVKLINLLKKDHYLKYEGGDKMMVFDTNWNMVEEIRIDEELFVLTRGDHIVEFSCDEMDEMDLGVELRVLRDVIDF